MRPLIGIRVCVFDAYGTVFDFASAAASCAEIPEDKRTALIALWRDKQLQYIGCARFRDATSISGRSREMGWSSRSTAWVSRHRGCGSG